MKKQILSLALVAGAIFTVNAQIYTANGSLSSNRTVTMNGKYLSFSGGTGMFLDANCNLGLGTTSPAVKFEVVRQQTFPAPNVDNAFFGNKVLPPDFTYLQIEHHMGLFIQQRGEGYRMRLRTEAPSFERNGIITKVLGGYMEFNTSSTTNTTLAAVSFGTAETELMRINQDGKVRIASGTIDLPTPAGYRLFVDEGILTEKVKVALKTTADWADYVFASDYKLMPLSEVEKFTKENKHLPNVPSAEEMVEKGLNVAEMDAKLLEKIEELTLYLIEQQKQIEELKNEVKNLKSTK